MALCKKCGNKIGKGQEVCPKCGTPAGASENSGSSGSTFSELLESGDLGKEKTKYAEPMQLGAISEAEGEFDKDDVKKNRFVALLAYLPILVLISVAIGKKSNFARFHANQGLVLFLVELAYFALFAVYGIVMITISKRLLDIVHYSSLVHLVFVIFIVIGIKNVMSGKRRRLPFLGNIQLLKK